MATVTGVTAERAQEIENASVTGAKISGNDLVLVTKGGTEVNVGRIIPPAVDNWPVGSIFMNTSPTNPAALLGGGTWVRWGKGRVPVSLDEAQVEFDAAEKQNSSATKSHTLGLPELPGHNHGGASGDDSPDHAHGGVTDTQGAHNHGVTMGTAATVAAGGQATVIDDSYHVEITSVAGAHGHNYTTYGSNARHAHGISSQGGGLPHNNLQPYITCYMWKRTA